MADGEGFEPSVVLPTAAFQATALDHYATRPIKNDKSGYSNRNAPRLGRRFCGNSGLLRKAVELDPEFEDEPGVGEKSDVAKLDFVVIAPGVEGHAPDGREIAFAFVEEVGGAGDGDVFELGGRLENFNRFGGVDEESGGWDGFGFFVGDDAEFAEFDETFFGGGGDAVGDGDGADVLVGGGIPEEESPGGGGEGTGAAVAADLHEVAPGAFGDHLFGEGFSLKGADLGVGFVDGAGGRFFAGDGLGRGQGDGNGGSLEGERGAGFGGVGEGFVFDGEGARSLEGGVVGGRCRGG